MAESISEGTLSSFTKQVGDHLEQDEEIASIETDKVTKRLWRNASISNMLYRSMYPSLLPKLAPSRSCLSARATQ